MDQPAKTFSSLPDLLSNLSLTGEDAEVECKESAWRLPRDVWETVSAFANTADGTLLLGIAERGGQFEITGLIDAPAIQHALVTGLHDQFNVPIPAQVEPIIVSINDEVYSILWSKIVRELLRLLLRIPLRPLLSLLPNS